jgi:uncharacterized protein
MHESSQPVRPWYRDGLRFQCTGCGGCCTGDPGWVWVNQAEIDALARTLGMTPETFERAYVRTVGRRRSLREMADGDCVFYDPQTARCRVYAVRPRQCRSWPFWPSNIRTPQAWQHTCEACPGAGQGPKVSLAEIETQRGVIQI